MPDEDTQENWLRSVKPIQSLALYHQNGKADAGDAGIESNTLDLNRLRPFVAKR